MERQYRPNFTTLDPAVDPTVRQFHVEVQQAFRQTFDLLNSQANTQSPTSLFIKGTGSVITVSTKDSGIGLHLSLSRPGSWVLTASVCLNLIGDANQPFTLSLVVGAVTEPQVAIVKQAGDGTVMLHQAWQVKTDGGDLCRLVIHKKAGAGTSNVDPTNSTLTATWQGN